MTAIRRKNAHPRQLQKATRRRFRPLKRPELRHEARLAPNRATQGHKEYALVPHMNRGRHSAMAGSGYDRHKTSRIITHRDVARPQGRIRRTERISSRRAI